MPAGQLQNQTNVNRAYREQHRAVYDFTYCLYAEGTY